MNYRGNNSNQRYSNRNQDHSRSRDRDGRKEAVPGRVDRDGRKEAVPGRVPNPGTVPKTDTKIEGKVGITAEIGAGLSLDPDPLLK